MGSLPTSPVKVTDLLLNMIGKAERMRDVGASYAGDLELLREKHVTAAHGLLREGSPECQECIAALDRDIEGIKSILTATEVAGMRAGAFEDFVVGHGELWSARMTALRFRQAGADVQFMDAREVITVSPTETREDVDVLYDESNAKLDAWGEGHGVPRIVVCTGFIARYADGRITTLKRNGSDYTATIMGALLRASRITIWSDVNGVYSADPRKVKEAESLGMMSYNEAWELAYFGANVLHPRSTIPAMRFRIPLVMRNMFDRSHPGTVITTHEEAVGMGRRVKGFATIEGVSLIEVMGSGMVGVPGTASAIFGAVRDAGINVIMISQASSEHSVCFAVKMAQGEAAVECLSRHFASAIKSGRIHDVYKIDNCTVLAAVGEDMASQKGVSAKLFTALAKAQVNVRATAQGASEYNITIVIDGADSARALKSVHSEFYAVGTPMAVALVGPGRVGKTLLRQLRAQIPALKEQDGGIDMRVLAIATSTRMLLSETAIDLAAWEERFEGESVPVDLVRLGSHLKETCSNAVVVDCTSSDETAGKYLTWVGQGLHVVTPNKAMGSGDLQRFRALKALLRQRGLTWYSEMAVGTGLPVLHVLRHLVNTGDQVRKIEGLFSGPLASLHKSLGQLGGRTSQDSAGEDASAAHGGVYGVDGDANLALDVARKLVILSREAGAELELSAVSIDPMVPEALRALGGGQGHAPSAEQIRVVDDAVSSRAREAERNGEVLRFVGVADVDEGRCEVGLRAYRKDHPFATLDGNDDHTVLLFHTQRFAGHPLVVRGPGAGAEVTAAGVFGDLLRLAQHLGSTM